MNADKIPNSMPHVQIREEIIDRDTGYSIDIVVQSGNARGGIALEVDGPSHFLRDTRDPTGATVMKRRHLGMPLTLRPSFFNLIPGLFSCRSFSANFDAFGADT